MSVHPSDPATLASLTDALADPDADLDKLVSTVLDRLHAAVPSLLSLHLTVVVSGHPLTVSAPVTGSIAPGAVAATSVRFPLGAATDSAENPAELLLRASARGAFVDFAADAAHELGIALTDIRFDADVVSDDHDRPGRYSVEERSTIDQAVGVCLDRGHTAADARAALQERADAENISVVALARAIIDGRSPPDPR